MNDALEDFGERVVAVSDTKESALRHFLDNKLYENVYKDLCEEVEGFDDEFDRDAGQTISELREWCGQDYKNWVDFFYDLSNADYAESKSDDADALKSSGVDFSKSKTNGKLDTWSGRGY